jgi:cytochrome c2
MVKLKIPDSLSLWILWHCVAAIIVVLIPSQLVLGRPVWTLSGEQITFLTGIVVSYLAAVVILVLRLRSGGFVQIREVVLTGLATFGVYSLVLLMGSAYYSRSILAAALIAAGAFMVLSFALKGSTQKPLLVALAAAVVSMQALGERPGDFLANLLSKDLQPRASRRVIETTLYSIKAQFYDNYVLECPGDAAPCRLPRNGGGLALFGNGYLVATGEGSLHFLSVSGGGSSLESKTLPYRIPINSDVFRPEVEERSLNLFRVTDILVQDFGERFRLFAAHHFWKTEQKCFVLRVSSAEAEYAHFLSGTARLEWKQVYETEPCLPLRTEPRSGGPFAGGESGGRLVLLDDRRLLLSVGDHDFNGWHRETILAQDEKAAYGKTILIRLAEKTAEVYSRGHRNPQGLYVDREGTVWLTEHGPEGGDELNVVSQGANYGWPYVTFGTASGRKTWPPSAKADLHGRSVLPLYAWVPDIAVSDLIRVEGELFKAWQHDLLIASLKKTLWRARLHEGRVVYVEPIELRGRDARIRDIVEDRDGRIVLWMDNGSVVFLEPAPEGKSVKDEVQDGDSSRQLLLARCGACHAVADGTSHGIGPDLAGVVNRRIAGATGYGYSNALRRLSGTWTEHRLDEFLANPQGFAPGTAMQFEGISDPEERARLIVYLKTPS